MTATEEHRFRVGEPRQLETFTDLERLTGAMPKES